MGLPVEHFADGTNNNCDSIKDWDNADKVIYSKITANATAVPKHHLDVIYPIALSSGFSRFQTNAFSVTFKTVGSSAFVSISRVVDSLGSEQSTGFPAATQSTTKSTFTITRSELTGTFLPSTIIYIFVRGEGNTGTPFVTETCFIGPMQHFIEAND